MAADITLWQMLQDTKNQKIETKKDYISALWAEYKRENSDKILGHMVGEIPTQTPAEQQELRRPSLTRMPPMSRSGSFDSNTSAGATVKAPIAVPSPPAVPTNQEQPRRSSWWRRSQSNPKDMENFIHMAFSVS